MLKFTIQLFLSALLFVCFSCSQSSKENSTENPSDSAAVEAVPEANAVEDEPLNTNSTDIPNTTSTTTAVALNPAHGQPGHRCDIPVGQPLNSGPSVQAQPTVPAVAPPTSPALGPLRPQPDPATTLSTEPVARLNPAHGQPGHDCAIPVGAPLRN